MNERPSFLLDGADVPFEPGQTVMQAALAAGRYIPHLCYHPEFTPHGSCKLCTVKVNGRLMAACTTPAETATGGRKRHGGAERPAPHAGADAVRRGQPLLPILREERQLRAAGPWLRPRGDDRRIPHFFPDRPVDASHPEILLDFNRCILCELCVRAAAKWTARTSSALAGRGLGKHLIVNAESGRLADTDVKVTDKAVEVCPVGVILRKRVGFAMPIGAAPLRPVADQRAGARRCAAPAGAQP